MNRDIDLLQSKATNNPNCLPAPIKVVNWCLPTRDARAFLQDVANADRAMEIFTVDIDALSYSESALVNAAVERKFEIIGEALNQLSKCATVMAAKNS